MSHGVSPRRKSSAFNGPLPYHGRCMLALRPAWASWIAGTAPCERRNVAMRASGAICASLHIPMSPWVMRPCFVTAVASTITMPAPPSAKRPRWTKCQSLARPSSAEYWHIGEMMMRFFVSMPRNFSVVNRRGLLIAERSIRALFEVRVFHRDLAVAEREDVAAFDLELPGRRICGHHPFGDTAIARDEMFGIVPAHVLEAGENFLDALPHLRFPDVASAARTTAAAVLKEAIVRHRCEDRVGVVPVPGVAECVEKGGSDLGHGNLTSANRWLPLSLAGEGGRRSRPGEGEPFAPPHPPLLRNDTFSRKGRRNANLKRCAHPALFPGLFFTSGQRDSDSGWNASSAGIVEISL